MKKVSLLVMLVAFVCGNMFAQNYNFDQYTAGDKVAQTIGEPWSTWSSAPGGAEDGVFSDEFAASGNISAKFAYGVDQIFDFNGLTSGVYTIDFNMYVPNGKDAHINIQHNFTGGQSGEWAFGLYFNTSEGTILKVSSESYSFSFPFDAWFPVHFDIDLNNDAITLEINNVEVHSWAFSEVENATTPGLRVLDVLDFFPPTSASKSVFYIDDFNFVQVSGGATAQIAVSETAIYEELDEDEVATKTFVIANEGGAIGDWSGYIDFGHGAGGSAQQEMNYDNGNPTNLSGLQTANMIELSNKFPATAYAGSVMGTKLKNVKYFVAEATSGGHGFTGGLTMRAYKANANGTPGELLAEKAIPENQVVINDWNTATFDEEIWITGYDLFVSVSFQQVDGGFPVVFDDASMVPGVRYLRIAGEGSWYLVDDIWTTSNYNFCLRATCEGTPIPGSWVSMNKNCGTIAAGAEEEITLTFSTLGLSNGNEYTANMLLETSDEAHPSFNIPITLKVGTDGVAEVSDKYSIYPNPATTQVTLEGENLNTVAIYNVAGQLLRVVKLDNVVNTIEMDVEAGVYFFNIYDNNGNSNVQRVVITK